MAKNPDERPILNDEWMTGRCFAYLLYALLFFADIFARRRWQEHPTTRVGPITREERINSLDPLGGFALLGILSANVLIFCNPQARPDYVDFTRSGQ